MIFVLPFTCTRIAAMYPCLNGYTYMYFCTAIDLLISDVICILKRLKVKFNHHFAIKKNTTKAMMTGLFWSVTNPG